MTDRHLVDISEAQRVTGLAKSTLYKLAAAGHIHSFKVLTALRFDRADLLALVQEREVTRRHAERATEQL